MARGNGSGRKRPRVDWKKARRLYERDGLPLAEIARRVGCKPHTVSAHRDGEGWAKRVDIGREAAGRAAEKIADEIVRETAPAIVDSVKEIERQRQQALRINGKILDGLEGQSGAPAIVIGEGASIDLVLRRACLNLTTLGGRADGDGPPGGGSDEDSSARSAAVCAALAELDRDGSGRG